MLDADVERKNDVGKLFPKIDFFTLLPPLCIHQRI